MISSLEEAHEIIHEGKIEPDVFWPAIGYDIDLIQQLAVLGSAAGHMRGSDVEPGLILAAMQLGAILALAMPKPGTTMPVEI
jgi:hypothetical protein